jgi:hypothetical protein
LKYISSRLVCTVVESGSFSWGSDRYDQPLVGVVTVQVSSSKYPKE